VRFVDRLRDLFPENVTESHHRGHPVCDLWFEPTKWDLEEENDIGTYTPTWYSDTGAPVESGERPCPGCGLDADYDGPDPCLGWLPGVLGACCGHGRTRPAYVMLEDRSDMRGAKALAWFAGQQRGPKTPLVAENARLRALLEEKGINPDAPNVANL